MSKLLKIFTAFLACSLLTVSAFAAVFSWSKDVSVGGVKITESLRLDTSQNSRTFYAITSTDKKVSTIESTVTVVRQSDNSLVVSDNWPTTNSTESEAFYSVSYSGIPAALKAKGKFVVTNGGVVLVNYTSGYFVYE